MSAWPLRKSTWSASSAGSAGADEEAAAGPVPPLDLAQPDSVETATFALG